MIQTKTFIGALLAAGMIPLVASAQSGNTGQKPAGGQPGSQAGTNPGPQAGSAAGMDARGARGGLALQRSEKLIGMDVQDRAGQKLGRVDDFILKPNGEIAYVILSGSGPDAQAKQYPVPWRSVQVQMAGDRSGDPMAGTDRTPGADRATLSFDKDRLSTAPSFDRTQWPKAGDNRVFTESDTFFGGSSVAGTPNDRAARPVEAGMTTNAALFRASQLRNQAVMDATGAPAGTIGQLMVDPVSGRVTYVSFATGSTVGAPGRTVAVPWDVVQASHRDDKDRFLISVPPDRLQSAPEFRSGEENWKQMSDPAWVRDVYTYYSVRPYWTDTSTDTGRNPGAGSTPKRDEPKREEPKRDNPPPK